MDWVPRYTGVAPRDQCKLTCQARALGYYYVLEPRVRTRCPWAPAVLTVPKPLLSDGKDPPAVVPGPRRVHSHFPTRRYLETRPQTLDRFPVRQLQPVPCPLGSFSLSSVSQIPSLYCLRTDVAFWASL